MDLTMMNLWLILPGHEVPIIRAMEGPEPPAASAERAPTLQRDGSTAVIPIVGPLVPRANERLRGYGIPHTGYSEIVDMVAQANEDPAVDSIVFAVDSPGGVVAPGLKTASDAIFTATKPTRAIVQGMAASAAYWLASQAETIEASSPLSAFGSIGVAVDIRVDPFGMSITSTGAPNKRPDPTTKDGQDAIKRQLDDIHAMFVEDVARGRGVPAEKVARDFGKGGVLLATAAASAGMIDRKLFASLRGKTRARIETMDLETLRATHPDLCAQLVAQGVKTERARVCAHLQLAAASKAYAEAAEHITSGVSAADDGVIAAHLTARMASMQITMRAGEAPGVVNVAASASSEREQNVRATFAGLLKSGKING